MCIRDSILSVQLFESLQKLSLRRLPRVLLFETGEIHLLQICLLYTSDAADERSSVDLGGRRIIKKKITVEIDTRKLGNNKKQKHARNKQKPIMMMEETYHKASE